MLLSVSYCYAWAQAELSVSDQEKILAFIKEYYPEKYEEVIALKESHQEFYQQSLINAYNIMQQQKKEEGRSGSSAGLVADVAAAVPRQSAQAITDEAHENEILEIIRSQNPQEYQRVLEYKTTDPQAYQQILKKYTLQKESREYLEENSPQILVRIDEMHKRFQQPLSFEEENEVLAFIRSENPQEYDRILGSKKNDPVAYRQALQSYKLRKESKELLQKNNPEVFQQLEMIRKRYSEPISPEQEEGIQDFIRSENPSEYERIMAYKTSNPQAYQQILQSYRMRKDSLESLQKNNPEAYKRLKEMKEKNKDFFKFEDNSGQVGKKEGF